MSQKASRQVKQCNRLRYVIDGIVRHKPPRRDVLPDVFVRALDMACRKDEEAVLGEARGLIERGSTWQRVVLALRRAEQLYARGART
eukprot:5714043-Alexandrium_andersonii.AAC.1